MNILVFNCGSSSLTYKVFEVGGADTPVVKVSGKAHRVGVKGSEPSFIEHKHNGEAFKTVVPISTHHQAAGLALQFLHEHNVEVTYVGHRFVHGGNYFKSSVFLDEEDTLNKLRLCVPLAPIHNPISLNVIYESQKFIPYERQYVTFDSAFHATIPPYAYTYALPKKIINDFGFRKFGFHGLSYSYTVKMSSQFLGIPKDKLRIVACHLGTGGSSVAAIDRGSSRDTSMGYSPLPGLIMSTRSGDIDPMLTLYLMSLYGYRPDALMDILNKKSGLLGISGFSSDINDIVHRLSKDEEKTELAFGMYVHRLRKYVGSYVTLLGGINALVFTDDIGVKNPLVREKVCERMEWCGVILDPELNRNCRTDRISALQAKGSHVTVLSIPTDEELIIYLEGAKILKQKVKE